MDFLRAKEVASFKLPERIVTVDGRAPPRNPIGKLQRRDIRSAIEKAG